MFKSLVILCLVCCVVIEARPTWQFLPPVPGYVPVYIQAGDTPLEEINPELAEAFHTLPAGRSAGKHLDAVPDISEQADQPQPNEIPEEGEDYRPHEKIILEKEANKVTSDIPKPVERR